MQSCEAHQALLLEYLFDVLDDVDRTALEQHLAGVPNAPAALEKARRQQHLLAAAARGDFSDVRFTAAPAEVRRDTAAAAAPPDPCASLGHGGRGPRRPVRAGVADRQHGHRVMRRQRKLPTRAMPPLQVKRRKMRPDRRRPSQDARSPPVENRRGRQRSARTGDEARRHRSAKRAVRSPTAYPGPDVEFQRPADRGGSVGQRRRERQGARRAHQRPAGRGQAGGSSVPTASRCRPICRWPERQRLAPRFRSP